MVKLDYVVYIMLKQHLRVKNNRIVQSNFEFFIFHFQMTQWSLSPQSRNLNDKFLPR